MDICNTIKTDFNKTCELCLKLIDDISNCEVSDESVNDKIEVLFIKLVDYFINKFSYHFHTFL